MLFVQTDDKKYGNEAIDQRFAGQGIYNADAEHLGKVEHVYVNIDNPDLVYIQAFLGGGFLNFGSKEFLVPAGRLTARDDQFFLDMPKEDTKLQGRIVPGDGQSHLEGILAPPVGLADHASEGIKPAVGDPTGAPDGNFAANSGSYEGRRVGGTAVTASGKVTAIKGNRLYEPGGEQFGTVEEVYCDLSTGDPVLVKVRYGGDSQPGGFFSLFGSGHDVLVSLDALRREGDFYYLRDGQILNALHD